MVFLFQRVTWQEKRKELKQIREKVFVYEYHIPKDIEFDRRDEECHHLLAIDQKGKHIATARINQQGMISRVAVLQNYRTQSFYKEMFNNISLCIQSLGATEFSFNCNLNERDKFKRCGYSECGNVFMEAGIARQRLSCPLSQFDPAPFTLVH